VKARAAVPLRELPGKRGEAYQWWGLVVCSALLFTACESAFRHPSNGQLLQCSTESVPGDVGMIAAVRAYDECVNAAKRAGYEELGKSVTTAPAAPVASPTTTSGPTPASSPTDAAAANERFCRGLWPADQFQYEICLRQ
jgi:hypothetical protein